jgi:hypothetical protein
MTTRKMGEEGLRWFVAIVEDIQDPEKLGRVKIRVINEHDNPLKPLTVEELPWATPILPPTSAGFQQVGRSPTGLLVGSHVFGFYLDGHEKNLPLIWGSYAKLPGKDQAKNDVPALARGINSITKTPVGPEPDSAYNAQYPYNHVWQTKAGHVIEVDDTPNQERLHIYHNSGTYVEINHDGRRATKVVDGDIEVVIKDKTVAVGGNCVIEVAGSCTIYAKNDVTVASSNNIVLTSGADSGIQLSAPGGINITKGNVLVNDSLGTIQGATGTFTSYTGQIITVQDGIVTNIF